MRLLGPISHKDIVTPIAYPIDPITDAFGIVPFQHSPMLSSTYKYLLVGARKHLLEEMESIFWTEQEELNRSQVLG